LRRLTSLAKRAKFPGDESDIFCGCRGGVPDRLPILEPARRCRSSLLWNRELLRHDRVLW